MASLIQINNQIRQLLQKNKLVEMFYFGTPLDLMDRSDIKYPVVCFDIQDFPQNGNTEQFPYQFWFLDQITEDYRNDEMVCSDMLMLSNDFTAQFKQSLTDSNLSSPITRQRITADTGDRFSGIVLTCTIYQPNTFNSCQVPNGTLDNNYSFSKEITK